MSCYALWLMIIYVKQNVLLTLYYDKEKVCSLHFKTNVSQITEHSAGILFPEECSVNLAVHKGMLNIKNVCTIIKTEPLCLILTAQPFSYFTSPMFCTVHNTAGVIS